MIGKIKYAILLLLIPLLNSCIKTEAPNAEADIEQAFITGADELLQMEPQITENEVLFRLKAYDGNLNFAPQFTLSKGASISPASGSVQNFSQPVVYTVRSEDRNWIKQYTVSFLIDDSTEVFLYSFEHAETINTENPEGHYHRFYDVTSSGHKTYNWSSGNEGYNMLAASLLEAGQALTPAFYPTAQTPDGYAGNGVRLQTKATGNLGKMMGSPIAAGNLYIGTFSLAFPAIKSTKLGIPYPYRSAPLNLSGYYKYKAGDEFQINTAGSSLSKDAFDIYAILFEKQADNNFLPGDHNFHDPRMVSMARIDASQKAETDEWTHFSIPFNLLEGKTYDPEKSYMFTIVISSSIEGDLFNGAVGSTLYVDEINVETE